MLRNKNFTTTKNCSEGAQGLPVLLLKLRICTKNSISPN